MVVFTSPDGGSICYYRQVTAEGEFLKLVCAMSCSVTMLTSVTKTSIVGGGLAEEWVAAKSIRNRKCVHAV